MSDTTDFLADYVIIGGGSAGCVLANRLSENPAHRVVLLEAGGTADGFWNRLPAAGMRMLGNAESDWCFQTEPDPSLNGRQGFWNAGRMLGGGSSVNGMIYIRGDRSDYDAWAADGCTGWGWDDVLPHFRKSEAFSGPPDQTHSTLGLLGVSQAAAQPSAGGHLCRRLRAIWPALSRRLLRRRCRWRFHHAGDASQRPAQQRRAAHSSSQRLAAPTSRLSPAQPSKRW